jgi:4-diphosphocytidyl-2-C-methyl-D-erythritol kinase
MAVIRAPAPAKLNLFLHVVARRADGYHELQTVFQLLDHCDQLRFEATTDGGIHRDGGVPGLPPAEDLVVRAATALAAASGTRHGVRITLDKHIPAGGGLGGGSSDAATTLVALNRLWGLGWSTGQLAELGLELGADVPVFVHGRSAWAEGVGERLTPLELPERWFLVVDPGVSVSTAELFQTPELTRDSPRMTIRDFVPGGGHNDFEPVVRARHPEVHAALDWLSGFGDARLTGTGGCIFAAFDGRADAMAAHEAMPDDWQGFVARGLNRSPLIGA